MVLYYVCAKKTMALYWNNAQPISREGDLILPIYSRHWISRWNSRFFFSHLLPYTQTYKTISHFLSWQLFLCLQSFSLVMLVISFFFYFRVLSRPSWLARRMTSASGEMRWGGGYVLAKTLEGHEGFIEGDRSKGRITYYPREESRMKKKEMKES